LNSFVNYLSGVEIEDYFRYKIILENNANQSMSITQNISKYFVKDVRENNQVYRIIDTPGFGDTKGIETDQKHI
jgi:predicted GTPase